MCAYALYFFRPSLGGGSDGDDLEGSPPILTCSSTTTEGVSSYRTLFSARPAAAGGHMDLAFV